MQPMTQAEMAVAWNVPQSDISIAARKIEPVGKTTGAEHMNKRAANLYDPEPVAQGLIDLYIERRDNLRNRAEEWEKKKYNVSRLIRQALRTDQAEVRA